MVDFEDNSVLDFYLENFGLDINEKNRASLRAMEKELKLLFGRGAIRHVEFQAYLMMPKNFSRLV